MDVKGISCSLDEFNRFKLGDERAFYKIFEYYKPILFQRLCRLCPSHIDAEEILQEVFIQLFVKRHDIPDVQAIYPFLFIVAKRMAISAFRKEVVRQRFQLTQYSQWDEAHDQLGKQIEDKDLIVFLDTIVNQLPAQQQLIFRMSKIDELSYSEISDKIGISKNTVRNHLVAAYHFVRLRLENILFFIFFIKNIF
ncbi:RNA polymerase sigma factor [Sphingobacterium sp. SG20118]|uniref:RNA polymerase sigma factor n=1 Tax=Sphingobacterium TaxID=28453 RepID=UPI0004F6EBAC|nr:MULTISPECIES: sigma-70 family RNA polymerase sigma factor [Sphingobacterium]AIM37643.1 hypothetical protein KO02_13895 [Sphingobacterium sp. ML3W]MDH5826232.1 sigma-70 family RNA polymerase sigma factor [Sphingobacterium faecium]